MLCLHKTLSLARYPDDVNDQDAPHYNWMIILYHGNWTSAVIHLAHLHKISSRQANLEENVNIVITAMTTFDGLFSPFSPLTLFALSSTST